MVKKRAMVINGNKTLLFLKPGILNVLLVINKLVNDMVVLTPAKITDTTATSWLPIPVNLVLLENGVIKAHPDIVNVLFEHFVKYTFFLLAFTALFATYQNDSGYSIIEFHINNLLGINE
jgi:hypothetical protein